MYSINTFSDRNVVAVMMFNLQMEGGKTHNSSFVHILYRDSTVEGFGEPASPTDDQVVALIIGAHYIISRWK